MEVIILGCGSSTGVPALGCKCAVCIDGDIKNKRSRASIYIAVEGVKLLIDTSPDLRMQSFANNIHYIDAVIYTHSHADHVAGIDEVRSFNFLTNKKIPAYMPEETYDELVKRYDYVFDPNMDLSLGWYRPCLIPYRFNFYDTLNINGVQVKTFEQIHGAVKVSGIRIGNFAYSTDLNFLSEEALNCLGGLEMWIIDCLNYRGSYSHLSLEQSLNYIERVRPKRAVLTHLGHHVNYHDLQKKLPSNIVPAYDGMKIIL